MNEQGNCPYLIYKVSKSCVNCTGYRCTSAGREKKVDQSQLETCRDVNEYVECTRYIDTLPVDPLETLEEAEEQVGGIGEVKWFDLPDIADVTATVEKIPPPPAPVPVVPCRGCGGGHDVRASSCPYQGKPPAGMQSCLGIWCYANNKNIRVDKNCVNWKICTVFLMSKYKGVKFHNTK